MFTSKPRQIVFVFLLLLISVVFAVSVVEAVIQQKKILTSASAVLVVQSNQSTDKVAMVKTKSLQEQILFASTGRNDGGRLLRINSGTGAATLIGSIGFSPVPAVAVNSQGEIFGVSSGRLIQINSSTGGGTFITNISGSSSQSIAFDMNDMLYGGDRDGNIFTIDINTGGTSPVVSGIGTITGMSFNHLDNSLYISRLAGGGSQIRRIDFNTGTSTLTGNVSALVTDIAFDSEGTLYGVSGGGKSGNDRLFTMDLTTGQTTDVGPTGFTSVSGLSFFRVKEMLDGDVTGDGVVNVSDLIQTINIILGIGPSPSEQVLSAADVNGDGLINVQDLIAIINIILGL